ncbi:HSPA12-like nucleotide binding domain family protein [Metarhizium robertsii]|uniref:HSPA12-like nucleotide binding domain family protein n=1 Tax=Metarhizium robertsii TaxID=568076 RepID=A0A014N827_9HYPO|nr:HSPA12-like nucleotide binding domain family protein [Metarhizium robertsii]
MPPLYLTPEAEKSYEKRSSSVLVTQADYKSLFDPVVNIIIDLIDDQVSQIAERETASQDIVLVWALPSGARSGTYNLPLQYPARSVVVCGEVLWGLEGSIVRERNYGNELSRIYDPDIDANYDKTNRYVRTDRVKDEECLTEVIHWEMGKVRAL